MPIIFDKDRLFVFMESHTWKINFYPAFSIRMECRVGWFIQIVLFIQSNQLNSAELTLFSESILFTKLITFHCETNWT